MTASGRRIKRRGSGRSSCDEMEAPRAVVGGGAAAAGDRSAHSGNSVADEGDPSAQAAHVRKLLDAQKRAYEVARLNPNLVKFARDFAFYLPPAEMLLMHRLHWQ